MRQRKAFTLVELLVVIGIIALLVSILLPALGRARDQANRVACLSSLRELGNTVRIYAVEFKDALPIGYMSQRQFSYIMFHNNAAAPVPRVSQMGFLATSRIMKSPKAFYCTVETSPMFMFNTPENPWIFDNLSHPLWTTPTANGHVRLGYSARPIADWPSSTSGLTGAEAFTPLLDASETGGATNIRAYPRFSKQKNRAIFTDLIVGPGDVKRNHKTGINVLYANGSGRYVQQSEFMNSKTDAATRAWLNIGMGATPVLNGVAVSSTVDSSLNPVFFRPGGPVYNARGQLISNDPAGGIWVELDRLMN